MIKHDKNVSLSQNNNNYLVVFFPLITLFALISIEKIIFRFKTYVEIEVVVFSCMMGKRL